MENNQLSFFHIYNDLVLLQKNQMAYDILLRLKNSAQDMIV